MLNPYDKWENAALASVKFLIHASSYYLWLSGLNSAFRALAFKDEINMINMKNTHLTNYSFTFKMASENIMK